MAKQEGRKSAEDVRNEGALAKENRRLRAEKTAAYDAQYKAAAQVRRDKVAAEATAKP